MYLQTFYPFIDLMHKNALIFSGQIACLNGSYSSDNVDLDHLIWNDIISLSADRFDWKLSQIVRKRLLLTTTPRYYAGM